MVIDCGMRNGRAVRPEPPVNDDPGSDAIRKSMMTALSLTVPDHVLDSALCHRVSIQLNDKEGFGGQVGGPGRTALPFRNPQSAIDF
jgi:hypothetical protein